MLPIITIPRLHLEYRYWVAELTFRKEEIVNFEKCLEGVVNETNEVLVKSQIERFQNQFILQKEVIDKLKHNLHNSERQLAGLKKKYQVLD